MTAKDLLKELGGKEQKENFDWRILLGKLAKRTEVKQIIELGAHEGWSTKSILEHMANDARLYSVDLHPRWTALGDDPRLVKIVGNDVDMTIWRGVDLAKTDVWEIDSDHSYEHISKQWQLYSPYFKKGAVVAIDDIDENFTGVVKFWNELSADKVQLGRIGFIVV